MELYGQDEDGEGGMLDDEEDDEEDAEGDAILFHPRDWFRA
jgi:hypothetical protein